MRQEVRVTMSNTKEGDNNLNYKEEKVNADISQTFLFLCFVLFKKKIPKWQQCMPLTKALGRQWPPLVPCTFPDFKVKKIKYGRFLTVIDHLHSMLKYCCSITERCVRNGG